MPPKSAVAAYSGGSSADNLPWIWSTEPRGIGVYNYRYAFVNSRDFNFNLFSADGQQGIVLKVRWLHEKNQKIAVV
jgi:hypothetical protein